MLTNVTMNGNKYFYLGFIHVNLSNLSLLYPLAFAGLIYSLRNKGILGIILCEAGYLILSFLLIKISIRSGFVMFSIAAIVLLVTAVVKGWFQVKKSTGILLVALPATVLSILAGFRILIDRYYLQRLEVAFHPELYSTDQGYLSSLIRELLNNSNFIGKGNIPATFSSQVKIPIYYTDFILSHLIYNYGWITFLVICALFIGFCIIGLKYVLKQKSILGLLVSLSLMITIICQVLLYVVSNLGFNLLATFPLPLVSYGNVSLIINMALIGIMLSVFRNGDIVNDKSMRKNFSHPFIYREGDKLIINLK